MSGPGGPVFSARACWLGGAGAAERAKGLRLSVVGALLTGGAEVGVQCSSGEHARLGAALRRAVGGHLGDIG